MHGDTRGPHLLIVGGGREIPGLAREACPGLRTTVFCRMEVLPRVRDVPRNERLFVFADTAPLAEWLSAASTVNGYDRIDLIATYSEKDQDRAAAIGRLLGVRTHHPDTVRWVHDKVAMRHRLAEAGVDDTPVALVRTVEEAREAVARLGLPLVCKPVRGVASKGVSRIERPEELPEALSFLQRAATELDSPDALLEPLHHGRELSVECLSEDGEHVVAGITGKFSEPEHFIETGHVVPADLDEATAARVERSVVSALDALGVRDGVTHTEVIVTEAAVRIIETHLRPGGDEIPYLLAEATGVDLIDALARQSVGARMLPSVRAAVDAARQHSDHAAIWYVTAPTTGTLSQVTGVEKAQGSVGVTEVEVLLKPGDAVDPAHGSSARAAHVRAVGASAAEAVARARSAADLLTVVVDPDTEQGAPAVEQAAREDDR